MRCHSDGWLLWESCVWCTHKAGRHHALSIAEPTAVWAAEGDVGTQAIALTCKIQGKSNA